jgi:hypothetical protein
MICAENPVQGTALRRKLGLSVPVISLLAAIRAVIGVRGLGDRACAANLTGWARKLHP